MGSTGRGGSAAKAGRGSPRVAPAEGPPPACAQLGVAGQIDREIHLTLQFRAVNAGLTRPPSGYARISTVLLAVLVRASTAIDSELPVRVCAACSAVSRTPALVTVHVLVRALALAFGPGPRAGPRPCRQGWAHHLERRVAVRAATAWRSRWSPLLMGAVVVPPDPAVGLGFGWGRRREAHRQLGE